jgi:hypothetical protein
MLSGEKLALILPAKCAASGNVIEAFGARFHLVGVLRTTLEVASRLFCEWDGCSSADEFRQLWTKDHPDTGYRPKQTVYVHVIKRIEDASE